MKKSIKILCSLVLALFMISIVTTPVHAESEKVDIVEINLDKPTVVIGSDVSATIYYTLPEGYTADYVELVYASYWDDQIVLQSSDGSVNNDSATVSYTTKTGDSEDTYDLISVYVSGYDNNNEPFYAFFERSYADWYYNDEYIGESNDLNSSIRLFKNISRASIIKGIDIYFDDECFEEGDFIKASIDYYVDVKGLDIKNIRFEYKDANGNYAYLDSVYANDSDLTNNGATIRSASSVPKGSYKLTKAEFTLTPVENGSATNYTATYTLMDNGTWKYYDNYSDLSFEVADNDVWRFDNSKFGVVTTEAPPLQLVSLKSSLTSDPTYLTSGTSYTYTMRVKNVSNKNITYNLNHSYSVNGGRNEEYGYMSMGYASLTSAVKTLKPGETLDIPFTTIVGLANYTSTENTPNYFHFNFTCNNIDYVLFVSNTNYNEGASVSYTGRLDWKENGFNRSKNIETVKTAYYSYKVYEFKSMSLASTAMTYTGSALKPAVTIKDTNGKVVGSNCYRVVYSNNTNVGKATATLQFKSYDFETGKIAYWNYDSDEEKNPVGKKTFNIKPKAASAPTLANANTGITVKWSKVSSAGGYKIYRSTNGGSYSLIKTITSNSTVSYADTKANTNGNKYTYKIMAYKTVSGTTYNAASYSPTKTTYKVLSPTISSLTAAKKAFTVKWAKNSKASGYQIQYSTKSDFSSGNKTATVTSASTVSKKISSLTAKKKYYVRIRTYKTVSGTKYYSTWSAKKYVTTK